MSVNRWCALLVLVVSEALCAGPSLTIYNNDLVVVKERPEFDLKEGEQTVRYSGVPARVDPTSVRLEGEGVTLLEQDYDFDLVSPDRVLEKYIGQQISTVGHGGQVFSGQLLSYESTIGRPSGQLLLKESDGHVQMLNRADLASVEFPGLPGGLLTRPTLVWKLRSAVSGRRSLVLTYMSAGIHWHTEYVGVLDDDETRLSLNAWVSIDNQSGASFDDADIKLLAGDVHRSRPSPQFAAANAAGLPPPPAIEERTFSDYHLYTLAWPVTLSQASVKQVQLFNAPSVSVQKSYIFDAEQLGPKVAVTLDIPNKGKEGLGLPLPAGKWRIFKTDGDKPSEFVGEDSQDHCAEDETLHLALGSAFDVDGERTVLSESRDRKSGSSRREVRLELRNHNAASVSVTLREHAEGEWTLDKSDVEFTSKDAHTFEGTVTLKPGEAKSWEYSVTSKTEVNN